MASFEWGPPYRLGIAQVDDEHQRLAEQMNALHEAVARGRSDAELSAALGELIDAIALHFRSEEAMYHAVGFPGAVGHGELHAEFVARASALKTAVDAGADSITLETVQDLSDWLGNHILKSDRAGCDFLRSRGVG
jgi:hemerythrin-like metal-binding protein